MVDRILSKHDICRLLGCNLRSLDRYLSLKRIPFCRVGRLVVFSWARLCEWLNPEAPAPASALEPEEIKKLEKERQAEEAEEPLRGSLIESERQGRLTERADKTI